MKVTNTLAYSGTSLFTTVKGTTVETQSSPVACTINIYNRRFNNRNDIGLYYNTLETIVIDDPSLS